MQLIYNNFNLILSFYRFKKTFKFGYSVIPVWPNIYSTFSEENSFLAVNDTDSDDNMPLIY